MCAILFSNYWDPPYESDFHDKNTVGQTGFYKMTKAKNNSQLELRRNYPSLVFTRWAVDKLRHMALRL